MCITTIAASSLGRVPTTALDAATTARTGMRGLLTLLAVAAMSMPIGAKENLIVNGGFESGTFSNWTTSGLTCSGVAASGAATGCIGIDSDPGPHSGAYAAYLGTAGGGAVISQAFATFAGETYKVDFDLAVGAYQGSTTPNSLLVQFGGTTLLNLANAGAQGWTHYEFDVTATGSSTTLSFTHQMSPSWFVLDDVSVVPEPATIALLGLGFAGLAAARRRRQ